MPDLETIADEEAPDNIAVFCTTCEKIQIMHYIGTQQIDNMKLFDMYNCPECHTTVEENFTRYYRDNYEI